MSAPAKERLDAREVLELAAIYVERGWCQRALAIDEHGAKTFASSNTAVAWCADGAMFAAAGEANWKVAHVAEGLFREWLGDDFVRWNDDPYRTQAEVVAALRAAAGSAPTKNVGAPTERPA